MTIKRIITLLMIFFALLLFISCGNDTVSETGTPKETRKGTGKETRTEKSEKNLQYQFKKVFTYRGTEEHYLKYPYNLYPDKTGSLYFLDSQRLLRVDPAGVYNSLLQKGQGPGEITYISGVAFTPGGIAVHNNFPSKLIRLDNTGKFLKEMKFTDTKLIGLIHHYDNGLYFLDSIVPPELKSNDYGNVDLTLVRINQGEQEKKKVGVFPLKSFIAKVSNWAGSFSIAEFKLVAYQERYLFISHTERYSIKVFDLKDKRVIREFSIPFQPQEIPEKLSDRFNSGMMNINGKEFYKPKQKYFNDIRRLMVYKENIWAVTSEVNPDRGIRVDVFSFSGEQQGRFYLRLPGSDDLYSVRWTIQGEYLYAIEKDSDDNPVIGKYHITGTVKKQE